MGDAMTGSTNSANDHVHLDPKTAVGDFADALDPAIGQAAGLHSQFTGLLQSVQLGGNSVGAIPGVQHLVGAFTAHIQMTGADLDNLHKAMTELQTAARTIQTNYDAAQDADKVSGDAIKAALNPAAAAADPNSLLTTPGAQL
jgi:hypothetical protein